MPLSAIPSSSAALAAREAPSAPFGVIDAPLAEVAIATTIRIEGWALHREGVRAVVVRVDGAMRPAHFGLPRADVAHVWPGFPGCAAAGFIFEADFGGSVPAHHELSVAVIGADGRETVLGSRRIIPPAALEQWRALYIARRCERIAPFHLVPALSGIAFGGAAGLERAYAGYLSPTLALGLRVPILYLRTTLGADRDWLFDPDWDVERRLGDKCIAEDSLSTVLRHSKEHELPVLFTLNGGVWADAGGSAPYWDVNDHLEQDPANCQWNERNAVMPDDYLKHVHGLPGSPEIARSLTFNVYAERNRHYKRRNLQAAARLIMTFAKEHPELFLAIALDADTYMNPFFEERQWYDYNPGTLRQFREWLAGSGPYAGMPAPGVPDLSRYRRRHTLTLAEVGKLAGRSWRTWDEVDPPRAFPREGKPFWKDAWTREWEVFRRHLVHLHYEELARWLVEVDVPKDRIYASQGFIAPAPDRMPFALTIDSPSKNFDTGGMSVEGAIPSDGHLAAIVYGKSAENDIRVERDANLFATFHRMDPRWAVGEFNTADFRHPKKLPTYAMGYRAFREMFNYGARFVSPMAWNGSEGSNAGQPGYVSFIAWRNTPLEEALRDFAVTHAYVPLGARLWTFGSARHADADGWKAIAGRIVAGKGHIDVRARWRRIVRLLSPTHLALGEAETDLLVLGTDASSIESVAIDALTDGRKWTSLCRKQRVGSLATTAAGLSIPIVWPEKLRATDQIRITLVLRSVRARIRHVALYPRS